MVFSFFSDLCHLPWKKICQDWLESFEHKMKNSKLKDSNQQEHFFLSPRSSLAFRLIVSSSNGLAALLLLMSLVKFKKVYYTLVPLLALT